MALKKGMMLYCKNGETVILQDFDDDTVEVTYHGTNYRRPRSAIGHTLFAHYSMINEENFESTWGFGRKRYNNPQWGEIYGFRYFREDDYFEPSDDEQDYEENISDYTDYSDYDDPPIGSYGEELYFSMDDYTK